jgi:hypothetical protein
VIAVAASFAMVLIIVAALVAAVFSARIAVGRLWHGAGLAALTLLIGLPFWVTCDHHLLKVLPIVWWFDSREPFTPYFLLYLPLCLALAVPPAAALLKIARLATSRAGVQA